MAALKRIKQPAFLKKWLSNKKIRLGLWTSLFFVAMLVLLSLHFVPEKTTLEVGKVCPNDVIADRFVTYLDEKATAEKQEEALKDFEDIYKIDLSQYNDSTIEEITDYFTRIESINSAALDIGDQAEDIAEIAATAKKKMLKKSKHIQRMAAATIDMVNKSVEAFIKKDLLVTEEVSHNDDVVDALFEEIVNDLVDIIKKDEGTSEVLDMLMVAKYFERIGDHAVNIAEWVQFSITGEHKRL